MTRRRFTDSEQLLQQRQRPEDRRLSVVLVATVGTGLAALLTYLAIGTC